MRRLLLLLNALLLCCRQAYSQQVVAHFMIGNVPDWNQATWENDMRIAQDAHIDGFVLNMAESDTKLYESIATAFNAAAVRNFGLMFSFDYAGGKPEGMSWKDKSKVTKLINDYKGKSTYLRHKGKPIVSTFEGPNNAPDWDSIKAETGCFFIPSYSSLGAQAAMGTKVPDGLFSWAAWPWGNTDMNTYVDESYKQFLAGKDYMMPVSPWFYTNMPGFNKNWLWRGDDLWFHRWRDVHVMKPALVQIITWNDWGECHYIGPLRPGTYGAFTEGKSPYNYAENMDHDGWRLFLPFLIDTYKHGKGTVTNEGIVTWYRKHPKSACSDGGTTANTASQLQYEYTPGDVVQDRVFYSALLGSGGSTRWVRVTIGGKDLTGEFQHIPDGYVGIYHGSVATGGLTGTVKVTLRRDGQDVAVVNGIDITNTCQNGLQNYNAWVGYDKGKAITPIQPALALAQQGCIEGGGALNFDNICKFTCSYDYCPASCHCTKLGKPKVKPVTTGLKGYPVASLNMNYDGLCDFACNLDKGWCTSSICSLIKSPPKMPTGPSPFLPEACVAGTGDGLNAEICGWTCKFAHCPIHICKCTARGGLELHQSPDFTKVCLPSAPNADNRDYKNLCKFSGERHRCIGPCYDPNPPCSIDDVTYKEKGPIAGQYVPGWAMDPEHAAASAKQYITIVNLTPYTFRHLKDQSSMYQMNTMDFDDIAPGHSRQCVMDYFGGKGASNPKDDKGEAYYEVVGTSRKFNIKARTNIPSDYPRRTIVDLTGWGLGQREYKDPLQETGVTFVITGSEQYGYHHSLNFGTTNAWMNDMWPVLKDRKLKEVVMPGTHDSGMMKLNGYWGGDVSNTLNQALSIYDQLRVGSRWFDLRVGSYEGKFIAAHVNKEMEDVPVGGPGEWLDTIIDDINKFTRESPGEVIFIWFRYLCYFQKVFVSGRAKNWEENEMVRFIDKIKTINNRCGNIRTTKDPRFGELPMSKFRGQNNNGCVVLLLDTKHSIKTTTKEDPAAGIYKHDDHFDFTDSWAETEDVETLVKKQAEERVKKSGFFINQWLLTPSTLTSLFGNGNEIAAIWPTNPILYWAGYQSMTPQLFPNVLMQDYIGVLVKGEWAWEQLGAEIKTLAQGMNLYLVSENCVINKGKHPLKMAKPSISAARMAPPWNGIMYANGTKIDHPDPDFKPFFEPVLRNGTVFANGTVVQHSITAPEWDAADPWAHSKPVEVLSNSTIQAKIHLRRHLAHSPFSS